MGPLSSGRLEKAFCKEWLCRSQRHSFPSHPPLSYNEIHQGEVLLCNAAPPCSVCSLSLWHWDSPTSPLLPICAMQALPTAFHSLPLSPCCPSTETGLPHTMPSKSILRFTHQVGEVQSSIAGCHGKCRHHARVPAQHRSAGETYLRQYWHERGSSRMEKRKKQGPESLTHSGGGFPKNEPAVLFIPSLTLLQEEERRGGTSTK